MRYVPARHRRCAVSASAATVVARRSRLSHPRAVTATSVGFACLLSAAMFELVLTQHGGGAAAAVAAVTMTMPVAFAPRAPDIAGIWVAVATALNVLVFGQLVRCAAALPAVFIVCFFAGRVSGRRGRTALLGAVVSLVLECLFDPRLGVGTIALMVPIAGAFFAAGLYVRRRASMVTALRESAAKLHEQRERTAHLAVLADREELGGQLSSTLRQRMQLLADAAQGPGDFRDRFRTIEQIGRQALDDMRALVSSLRDAPTEPEPGLADLATVCARATTADVQLIMDGTLRPLPASIELSACRIVEQLLRILPDEPASRIRLQIEVARAGIDIVMAGPATFGDGDLECVRALSGARAALHGGTVAITDQGGQRRAHVWLPLVTAHA
jgi:signal transduction histidine kinase